MTAATNFLTQELFGGAERAKALAHLFENAESDFGPLELAQAAGVNAGNVSRLLKRWVAVGLLQQKTVKGRPRYQVAPGPALQPLAAFFGQQSALVRRLKQHVLELGDSVQAAALFGSMASGRSHADSDIDVLLLTSMSRLEAQALFKPLGRELGRPVNVLTYTAEAWAEKVQSGDAFVLGILQGALVLLTGDVREPQLAQAAQAAQAAQLD